MEAIKEINVRVPEDKYTQLKELAEKHEKPLDQLVDEYLSIGIEIERDVQLTELDVSLPGSSDD